MDERLYGLMMEHIRATTGTRKWPGDTKPSETDNLLPLLADLIRSMCQSVKGGTKYTIIAEQLPRIAEKLEIYDFRPDMMREGQSVEQIVKDRLVAMARKESPEEPRILHALVSWAWDRKPDEVRRFLESHGFDVRAAESDKPESHLAGSQGKDEGYGLTSILNDAKQHVIIIAQNHRTTVAALDREGRKYWKQISNALTRGVSVTFVAMHPDATPKGKMLSGTDDRPASAVDVWANYLHFPYFRDQLEETWAIFAEWHDAYRDLAKLYPRIGALAIYGSYFQPNSITIVDPDMLRGYLTISPRTSDHDATTRPHFLIRRAVDEVEFEYYHKHFRKAVQDGDWVRIYG